MKLSSKEKGLGQKKVKAASGCNSTAYGSRAAGKRAERRRFSRSTGLRSPVTGTDRCTRTPALHPTIRYANTRDHLPDRVMYQFWFNLRNTTTELIIRHILLGESKLLRAGSASRAGAELLSWQNFFLREAELFWRPLLIEAGPPRLSRIISPT